MNNIKAALEENVKKLLNVKTFWRELKTMFEKFHDLIKDHLEQNANKILDCSKIPREANEKLYDGQETADITRKRMTQESRKALDVACVVRHISRFYVEVSNKYLLVGLNSLQRITLLEPSRDHARMEEVRRELENDAKKAEEGILIIAKEIRRELITELSHYKYEAQFR